MINKWNIMKMRNFCVANDTFVQRKHQDKKKKRFFTNFTPNEDYLKCIKIKKVNIKKTQLKLSTYLSREFSKDKT